MANRLEHRVRKIEDTKEMKEAFVPITKIDRKFISPDGTVSGIIVTKLIDGAWVEEKEKTEEANKPLNSKT